MNPRQMPTKNDYVPPTVEELAQRVKRARQRRDGIAMTNAPADEIERMKASIALERANWDLQSAESCLKEALLAQERRGA